MKLLEKADIYEVFEAFRKQNPEPATELIYTTDYTLLVSVMLSAQATDKSVNKATEALYKVADTPEKMLELGQEKLESYIKSIGLYRSKAKHVIETSRILVEKHGGKIPHSRKDLEELPGVGRKTANVILSVLFGEKTIAVDTHILRIAPKIGLAAGTTPESVEKELLSVIPEEFLQHAHHWLVLHGRYICTARNPKCGECCISRWCLKNGM